eukprot:TRINITY_DN15702_c0_g1_i1.p1 TRINITY_DN15702_c0_g1~~TRINITY_DN15702_c0_g1_i1.p1  ORF type:complete len:131 (+),score=7.06 TRINITY_DN15702_c0_g1_i1:350-742(+)
MEGIREYLQRAALETQFNQGEHYVGEFWFVYAELIGLIMGIIVGCCEGFVPESDTECVIRIITAFIATFVQCVIILTLSLIHISEPTRLLSISYAVFCLKKKNQINPHTSIVISIHIHSIILFILSISSS